MGGGVTPDVTIAGRQDDPWYAFISQRGYMTSYAESYLTTHGKLAEPFEVSPEMLEDFKENLLNHGVRVPDEYWSTDQDKVKLKLKVEFTALVYGLVKRRRSCNPRRPASPTSRHHLPSHRADSPGALAVRVKISLLSRKPERCGFAAPRCPRVPPCRPLPLVASGRRREHGSAHKTGHRGQKPVTHTRTRLGW